MKSKYFFVIYLHNQTLKSLLDAMRLIADSKQKNFSHITVKGPYKKNYQKILDADNREINKGTKLTVTGAGNFFENAQNTVFWKCEENEHLYRIWKKKEEKTYDSFHPHITIYDGSNSEYAHYLYETISSYEINFSFIIDKLELYSSKEKGDLFNDLKTKVDYTLITEQAGFIVNSYNVDQLTLDERIYIIDRLCQLLEEKAGSLNNIFINEKGSDRGILLDA